MRVKNCNLLFKISDADKYGMQSVTDFIYKCNISFPSVTKYNKYATCLENFADSECQRQILFLGVSDFPSKNDLRPMFLKSPNIKLVKSLNSGWTQFDRFTSRF